MLKLEVLIFLKCRQPHTNSHEQMHTQDLSASLDDEANLIDFRESFWNSGYPTESNTGRIVMCSKKGLKRSVELLLYLNKFSEPSSNDLNFK